MLKTLIEVQRMVKTTVMLLKDELETKQELLKKIENVIYKNCEHNWIDDWIDIDPDTSKHIIYCLHCELQKR